MVLGKRLQCCWQYRSQCGLHYGSEYCLIHCLHHCLRYWLFGHCLRNALQIRSQRCKSFRLQHCTSSDAIVYKATPLCCPVRFFPNKFAAMLFCCVQSFPHFCKQYWLQPCSHHTNLLLRKRLRCCWQYGLQCCLQYGKQLCSQPCSYHCLRHWLFGNCLRCCSQIRSQQCKSFRLQNCTSSDAIVYKAAHLRCPAWFSQTNPQPN